MKIENYCEFISLFSQFDLIMRSLELNLGLLQDRLIQILLGIKQNMKFAAIITAQSQNEILGLQYSVLINMVIVVKITLLDFLY